MRAMVIVCIIANLCCFALLFWTMYRDHDAYERFSLAQDAVGVFVPDGFTAQFQGFDEQKKEWIALSPRLFRAKYRVVFEKEETATEAMKK